MLKKIHTKKIKPFSGTGTARVEITREVKVIPKSEFELYRKIIQGDLRPFLPQFSSEKAIKKLMVKTIFEGIFTKEIAKDLGEKIPDSVVNNLRLQSGDRVALHYKTNGHSKIVLRYEKIDAPETEDLIDLEVPPPSDLKAEYFLMLIQDEFYRIECSSKETLEVALREEEVSLYAKRNLQILKALCVEAHRLSKKLGVLNSDERDQWEPSNGYIMYVLKLYLIRSILHFQFLFKPYLDEHWHTEEDWRFELYNQMPFRYTDAYLKSNEIMEGRRREKGLPPPKKKMEIYFDQDEFDAFVARHPNKFSSAKKLEIGEPKFEGKTAIVVPIKIRNKLRELKDEEGGKVLALRLNVSERTLYSVIKGEAIGAITLRKIATADPQFVQLAELAQVAQKISN